MLDRVDEVQTIDVREELKDRFIGAYWFYLEGMEFRPGFRLTKREAALAAVFETLHDSVDAIPVELIASTEQIYAGLAPIEFEKLLTDQLDAVGRKFYPRNAAAFLESLHAAFNSSCECRN
jgi:hypothetical protein